MAGPAFMLWFNTTDWLWLFDRHSLEILLKAYQILLAHIDLLICITCLQTYTFIQFILHSALP